MLEDDYQRRLDQLLASCECDVAVPQQWQAQSSRRGVIAPIPGDRRRFVRHYFSAQVMLEYGQTFASIPRERTVCKVVTRDVSRDGIAFVNAEQLYPGERVTIWLPGGKRTYIVARCRAHGDDCFEIGASLSE